MRISDWSSDVCSSDLKLAVEAGFSAGVSYTGVLTSKYDQIGARVVALKDISGRHGSWVVSPTVEYGTPISKRAFIGLSARSEEHTSELQSLMRNSYAVFCL